MEKKKFMDTLTKLLFKDSDGTKEPEQKQMDGDKSELVAKIIAAANSSELDEAAKAEAIIALASELSGHEAMTDSEEEEKKTEDEIELPKKEEDEDEVVGEKEISITPTELAEIIEKVTDSAVSKQIAKLKDSMANEAKSVSNAYAEVRDALGYSFDYSGMSAQQIYKMGAEAMGVKVADGMDSLTAFKVASISKQSVKSVAKVSDSKAVSSRITDLLK